MRSYSIANKSYSTPMMVATMVGATIGGGSTLGIADRVFQLGLLGLFADLVFVIELSLTAKFIAPQIARFKDALSPGDIMEQFYGKTGRVCTGIAGLFKCIAAIGGQIFTVALLLQYFVGISNGWAIGVGSAVVAIYSAFGGLRVVSLTDAIQLAVLAIAIPMVCNIGLSQMGGYQDLFAALPSSHLSVINNPALDSTLLSVIFISSIPTLNPLILHRLLVAKDSQQLKVAVWSNAIIVGLVFSIVGLIGLMAFVLNPGLDSKMAFPYIINTVLPPGLRGFVLIGMAAIAMSVADSFFNVAGILSVRDIIKPFIKKPMSDEVELRLTRIATFLTGIAGVGVAFYLPDLFTILIKSRALWVPLITFPLLAGLLGFSVTPNCFIIGGIAAAVVGLIWQFCFMDTFGIEGMFMGFLANAISFTVYRLIESKNYRYFFVSCRDSILRGFQRISGFVESTYKKVFGLRLTLDNLLQYSAKRIERYGAEYTAFAIFFIFVYVIPHAGWTHENSLFCLPVTLLRFLGGLLCFFLLVRDGWPLKLKRYLPLYWHLTLLYNLPFLMVFMVLESNGSWGSFNNMLLGFLLLVMVVDWRNFVLLLLLGVTLAFAVFSALGGQIAPPIPWDKLLWAGYMCGFAVVIGSLFGRRKEKGTEEKFDTIRTLSGSMAHDLKLPLNAIRSGTEALKHHMPILLEAYENTDQSKLQAGIIAPIHQQILKNLPVVFENLTQKALANIDDILARVIHSHASEGVDEIRVRDQVDSILEQYPFRPGYRELVTVVGNDNFVLRGNRHFFDRVLFNLIQNSLEAMYLANKGEIRIYIQSGTHENTLCVYDTALGIPVHVLPHIFESFYSNKPQGTGIGLALCQHLVQELSGTLTCQSIVNEYTEFTLSFPSKN